MSQRFSCARDARDRDEPMCGTASPVRRWLLLEQDGPWGYDAVLESRLDPALSWQLKARARALSARLLLIRRHGRPGRRAHRAFVAVTEQRGSWAEELRLDEPGDLLDMDLGGLTGGASVGGRRLDGPLYLVCTNGRHDACCAEYGRPLARALTAAFPAPTWECSHVGGDRFAANLVCLPEGVYYGRLGPLEATRVAVAHANGKVVLEHYRGRSCHPFAVQAAEYFLRVELRADGIEDLLVTAVGRGAGEGTRAVKFETAWGERHVIEVAVTHDPEPQRLTCYSPRPGNPPRYALRSHVVER
jgi:hypothetical protein